MNCTSSRRQLLIGAGFSLAAVAAFGLAPRRHLEFLGSGSLEHLIPKKFGRWEYLSTSGLILPPKDQLQDSIYGQLVTRTYADQDGKQIMFLAAYNAAQDGVVQIHRPEICYPASGFKLEKIEDHITRLASSLFIPSRYVLATNPLRSEQILYWTRVGSDFPRKWSEQRWSVFHQNLQGEIPDGLLVRFSSVDLGVGVMLLDEFARDLYSAVDERMKTTLAGIAS
jgi:EpsI family protein